MTTLFFAPVNVKKKNCKAHFKAEMFIFSMYNI